MKNSVISIQYNEEQFPVIEVFQRGDQVIIRWIHWKGVHWSLHLEGKEIIFTSSNPNYNSTWSNSRVGIAKKLGYTNPEKHGHYVMHETLKRISGVKGYDLGSHRLNLIIGKGDNKYLKSSLNIGISKTLNPMLNVILSTKENKLEKLDVNPISTPLGDLIFKLEP
ncbi:MAG TPA: hypothetical protein VFX17_03460 [Patescibacteria group bacterium]|nr:hypothetical protein [Patescibacteria group bacterium]